MPERLLLFLGAATYKAGAFLAAAARLGLEVVVASDRPQALAGLNPQGHLTVDFRRPEEAAASARRFHRRHPIAAVAAADDDGALPAATAAEALGLATSPAAAVAAALSKLATREALARAGLPCPWFRPCRLDADPAALAEHLAFPCVVKPLDLSASRGVIRADDAADLAAAFRRLRRILGSRGAEILVEGFLPGREVAVEGLLTGGRLRVLALFDKPDPLDGPFFEETIYVTPSRLGAGAQEEIADAARRGAAALGLTRGPVHAELRFGDRGAWVLEIAPRSIGGLCSRVLRFAAVAAAPACEEITLEELILRHALGLDVGGFERQRRAAGVMMIPVPRAGTLHRVGGLESAAEVAAVEEVRITAVRGQEIAPPPEGSRYLGFIFARAAEPAVVEAALKAAHERLEIDIRQGAGNG